MLDVNVPDGGDPMQDGGQEMLASFLWAVGEDAIGSRNGQAKADDLDDEEEDDDDESGAVAMDGSDARGAPPVPAQQPVLAQPLAPHPTVQIPALPSAAAIPAAGVGGEVKGEGSESAAPAPPPQQLPTANFNLPGMLPNPAGLGMFGASMFNPLAAGLLPGMNPAALFGGPVAGLLPGMPHLGLPAGAGAYPRVLPISMMPPGMAGNLGLGALGMGTSGEHARNNPRLQRKAESARVARVRKKHYIATLELENSELRAKLQALQGAAQRGDGAAPPSAAAAAQPQQRAPPSEAADASAAERQAQRSMEAKVQEMCAILQRHSIDRLTSDVNSLVEQFVQNQRTRQQSINFHFNEITDLLDTGPQYKMAFWDALQARRPAQVAMEEGGAPPDAQGGADGEGGASGGPVRTGSQLLDLLVDELQMAPAQVDKLEACRKRCEEMQTSVLHCQQLVEQAREQVLYNIAASQQVMDNMRGVLTPQQVARFLVWVEKHKRSMEVFVHA